MYRYQTQIVSYRLIFISLIFSLYLISCNENVAEFTLGEEFVETDTNIDLIDTLSVQLSTVIIDSVITAAKGKILIGKFKDEVFGEIISNSYLQIGIPDSSDVYNEDIYDSLKLVIKYNQYSYGDTTVDQKIYVHQLTENIKLNVDGVITSKSSFAYDPIPLGSLTYTPRPHASTDTLAIKIRDEIGLELLEQLKDDSDIISNNTNFINYFHGLALLADNSSGSAIIGFNATEHDVKLILYTSRPSQDTKNINYKFYLTDTTRQFNQIKHDFTLTQLNNLSEQRSKLSSTNTSGLSFLQGGIGLTIRVDFPTLPEMLLLNRGKILKAQLSISPLINSYDYFKLPTSLVMYETDKNNIVLGSLGQVATSALTIDNLYNEETAYVFDIAEYLNNEISNSYIDPEKGLLIMLPAAFLTGTFQRLVMDATNQNTKLKIYYLSY